MNNLELNIKLLVKQMMCVCVWVHVLGPHSKYVHGDCRYNAVGTNYMTNVEKLSNGTQTNSRVRNICDANEVSRFPESPPPFPNTVVDFSEFLLRFELKMIMSARTGIHGVRSIVEADASADNGTSLFSTKHLSFSSHSKPSSSLT